MSLKRIFRAPQFPLGLLLAVCCLGLLMGCSRSEDGAGGFLIRVGTNGVTVSEFKQAVASARDEAFLEDARLTPEMENELQMRVLNQMTEQLLVRQRAAELGIRVSDPEIDQAVEAIRSDYPDDTFKEELLQNAVSFSQWRQKLADRLLMEKVIAKELIEPVEITPEDIAAYYQQHYAKRPSVESDSENRPDGAAVDQESSKLSDEDINARIVKHLHRQKAEQSYVQWMDQLHQQYPVQLNHRLWSKVSHGAKEPH